MRFTVALVLVGCGSAGPVITADDAGAQDALGPLEVQGADAGATLCPQGCLSPNVCWQSHAWVPDSGLGDLYGRCTTNCEQDPAYAAQCASLGGVCRNPVGADGGPDYQGGICERP